MKRLFFASLLLLAALRLPAQTPISLSGRWALTSRLPETSVTLPGSLLTNGIGDEVTVETQWTGSLYDSSFYFNPFMEPYRRAGHMKFPFFLTPSRHFTGEVTYSRSVTVPKAWRKRRVTLFLERPHIETSVRVNGREAGRCASLSVPHQYDITDLLLFGRDNRIDITVSNEVDRVGVGQDSHSVTDQTQGNWNGIAGRIELTSAPLIRRRRVITDLATGTAHILLNDTPYEVHIDNAQPWSEHSPRLYTVTLDYEGQPVEVTFGFRDIRVSGRDILLNGERIHLRGTVENCCFPETGFPPTDTASWERIFRICKSYGLNHMRFHSYCPPEAAFVAADRLGFYLQPEGPSWPNHGVKLGVGMPIDRYLNDECLAILDQYGSHPSFVMLAAGNEPAGRWVEWGADFVRHMKEHDPSRLYTVASVGGGWEWDYGSEYHVKGGARGLEWNRRQPSSDDDYTAGILFPRNRRDTLPNATPMISHEQGQWCAFPDLSETSQYTGAYRAGNFDIFRDLLEANGMSSRAGQFLRASGRLQLLAYKYETERHLRTPGYAGFQLLGLNDYSGQGAALVGVLNVHWREKGYCDADLWRSFCSDTVPLASFPRFTFAASDTVRVGIGLYQGGGFAPCELSYVISCGTERLQSGRCRAGDTLVYVPSGLSQAEKLTLTLEADARHRNRWDFWVYPPADLSCGAGVTVTSDLDSAFAALRRGERVLLTAAGCIRYGNDVVHRFLPVFWNTSWFKMRPPHTTGAYIEWRHPVFCDFPTDDWQDLQWWELTNRAQCMNLTCFPRDFQPIVQPIDTWHLSRKLGMLFEANVLGGRLLVTTLDITSDLDRRIVARQLRRSILLYMSSEAFRPSWTIDEALLRRLYEEEAPPVDMYTRDSPDELKPKFK